MEPKPAFCRSGRLGQGEFETDWGCENSENKKITESIVTICKENTLKVVDICPEELKEKLFKSSKDLIADKLSKIFFTKE